MPLDYKPDARDVLFDLRKIHFQEPRSIVVRQQIDLPSRHGQRTALLRGKEHNQLFGMTRDLDEDLAEGLFAACEWKGAPPGKRLSRGIYCIVERSSVDIWNSGESFTGSGIDDRQVPGGGQSLAADNIVKRSVELCGGEYRLSLLLYFD